MKHDFPESALVIAWDATDKTFTWFVHPDIPTDTLIGTLEGIKVTLMTIQMAREQAIRPQILGPNGRPIRG